MQRFGGKAMCKLLTGALTFAILTLAPMSGLAAIVETGGGFSIFDNSTNTSTISVTDDLLVDSLSLTLDIPAGTYAATVLIMLLFPSMPFSTARLPRVIGH
jgi:hypothetical protein